MAPLLTVIGTTQVAGALSGGDSPMQPPKHLARTDKGASVAATKVNRRDKFRAEAIRFYLDKRGLVVSTDGL